MEIRTGSIDFSAPLRGSGPRVASQTVVLPRQVVSAVVGLGEYTVAYSGNEHRLGPLQQQSFYGYGSRPPTSGVVGHYGN
jgi:hypothetical protein